MRRTARTRRGDGSAAVRSVDDASAVTMVHWPGEADRLPALCEAHVPRLLLVAADADPPVVTDLLEDWVRLPCAGIDIEARVAALADRVGSHAGPPTIDRVGRLQYRGASVYLSGIDARLAEVLIDRFDGVASERLLSRRGWDDEPGSTAAVRAHMDRLRRQLRPVGLEVRRLRGQGWILHPARRTDR